MGRIHLLEDQVRNKIAAGEVVERPASVVKELVENAIDAGGCQIDVDLEDGGKKSLMVRDNGHGIQADDIRLSVERHATSKIRTSDDLFQVETMGFRGEALASIASISRFSIVTACKTDSEASRLTHVDGNVELAREPISRLGTTVSVDEIFFNVPVRLGFLKSSKVELSYCLELIQAISLAHPEAGFNVRHNGIDKFSCTAHPQNSVTSEKFLRSRASAVWSKEIADQLLYVSEENSFGKVHGLVSPPGLEKATSKFLLSFVNGRWVKDKVLRYGILRGYQTHLLSGRYPIAVVHFQCDPSLVDVNVHPAKSEVRFQYPSEVQSLLATAIRNSIRKADWASPPEPSSPTSSTSSPAKDAPRPAQFRRDFSSPSNVSSGSQFLESRTAKLQHHQVEVNPEGSIPRIDPLGASGLGAEAEQVAKRNDEQPNSIDWSALTYIGSYRQCYLMFEGTAGMLIVDQHAFHERIVYEQLKINPNLLLESQPLVIPEVVDLSSEQVDILRGSESLLESCGVGIKSIGDHTVEVHRVPVLMAGRDSEELIQRLANPRLHADDTLAKSEALHHEVLATLACHGAIRAGEQLDESDVFKLVKEAQTVDFFHNCPHGRRVLRWFSPSQVGSWFDR